LPPYSIVAGNPAKIARKRFNDDEIAFLLEYEWWNLPISKLKDVVSTMINPKWMDYVEKLLFIKSKHIEDKKENDKQSIK